MNIEALKKRKKELRMTFDELAARSDVSISALKDIFRGDTPNPRVDTLRSIEKALGIVEDEPNEEERENGVVDRLRLSVSVDEADLLELYRSMDDAKKKLFVEIGKLFA